MKHTLTMEVLYKRANQLYFNPTNAEKEFRQMLHERNIKHRFQYVISPYIVDFLIGKIIIEIDGSVHDKQAEYDAKRTLYLSNLGFTVIRVRNEKVKDFNFNRITGNKKSKKHYSTKKHKSKRRANTGILKASEYEMVKQPNGDFKRVKISTGKHEPVNPPYQPKKKKQKISPIVVNKSC